MRTRINNTCNHCKHYGPFFKINCILISTPCPMMFVVKSLFLFLKNKTRTSRPNTRIFMCFIIFFSSETEKHWSRRFRSTTRIVYIFFIRRRMRVRFLVFFLFYTGVGFPSTLSAPQMFSHPVNCLHAEKILTKLHVRVPLHTVPRFTFLPTDVIVVTRSPLWRTKFIRYILREIYVNEIQWSL